MPSKRRKESAVMPPCPWLVYYHGKGYEDQTFYYNISGSQPVIKKIYRKKILAYRKVLTCSYGWLVLYDQKIDRFSLVNTSNFHDIIRLPTLELSPENEIERCILSSSPDNPDCMMFLFFKRVPLIMRCGLSDKKWSQIRYGETFKGVLLGERDGNSYDPVAFSQPVICGGKIYAKLDSELWSIDFVEEPGRLVFTSLVKCSGRNHLNSCDVQEYMLESDGELFSIFFMWGGVGGLGLRKIEVRKLNFDTMNWETLESIKNRSFYICRDYCLSCPASGSGRIYFIKNEDPTVYCYDMEDESFFEPLVCHDLPTQWLSPIWILPPAPRQEDFSNNCNKRDKQTGYLDLKESAHQEFWKNELSSSSDTGELFKLPLDILQDEIIKRLTPIDYLNFRGMNRISRQVASREKWRTTLLSNPLLMNTFRNRSHCNLSISLSQNLVNQNFAVKLPNYLKDATICYSDHGWMLMSRKNVVHLYNPFTKVRVSYLRPCEPKESFFFASKPSCSDFMLIGISFHQKQSVIVNIHYPGSNGWSNHVLETSSYFDPAGNTPVFFQDACYYLDQNGSLGKLKLEKRNCTWGVVAERPCRGTFRRNFLVECGGELLSVFLGRAQRWIYVYKLKQKEGCKIAWERVRSLSNYTLYLSQYSSFSMVASPGEGNKIYFPMFHGCGTVFYSLDTGKWQFFEEQDFSNDTELLPHSFWIKPSWC